MRISLFFVFQHNPRKNKKWSYNERQQLRLLYTVGELTAEVKPGLLHLNRTHRQEGLLIYLFLL